MARSLDEVADIANSGQGVGNLTKAEWQMVADNPGYTSASARAAQQQGQPQGQQQAGKTAEDLYWEQQTAYAAAQKTASEDAVIATVQGMFEQYGLSSLYPQIVEYARKGYSGDAIAVMLRNTPEYKARFPAMEALAKKGRAISEGQYIEYERSAAAIEQRYGLVNGMLSGHITELLTEEVSISELNDRVVLASADSLNAPQDLKDTLRDYYNLDPDTALASYYLDPDIAMPLLEKQSAAARIGVWGRRSGVDWVDKAIAESLQGVGVTEDKAQSGFANVKQQESLMYGKGDTGTQTDLLGANLTGSATGSENVERAAKARVGRFSGNGGFASGQGGVSGLGSASG